MQLTTSSRLPSAFIALDSDGIQRITAATGTSLEGLELSEQWSKAFTAATSTGDRTALLSDSAIPAQLSELLPPNITTVLGGSIVSSTGLTLGILVAYGSENAQDIDQSRVQHSIEIVERHCDDKEEKSTQRVAGNSLKIAGDKLQRYSEKLKFENENLDLFAEFAAHEVKNPLRAIMLCSDYLKAKLGSGSEDLTTEEVVEMLGQISDEAQVLYEQIENILALGKPESEYRRSETLDLTEIAQQCLQRYGAELIGISGTMEIGSLGTAIGDPAQVLMVLSNLVSNAIRYRSTKRNLVVKIESVTVEEQVSVSVSDNGIGIDPEDQQQVFDAYARCSPDIPGLGLGLALSRRSIEQAGGSIDVVSKKNEGSTFIVTLPQRKPA